MKHTTLFLALSLSLTIAHAQQGNGNTNNQGATADQASSDAFKKKTISISPATLYFNAGKGESQTLTINIENGLDSPFSFQVALADFNRNENSEITYFKPGTTPYACAQWITLSNNVIEVPAHSSGSVDVTLSVPDSADAIAKSTWGMVLLETVKQKVFQEQHGDINANIERAYRVGVQVYETPPTIMNKELRMKEFQPMPERGKYRIVCKNEGGVLLRCNSYIELVSKQTGEKIKVYPKNEGKFPFKVLPGQLRNIDFEIPTTVAKGKYTAVAIVDANDDEVPLEAAQLEIEVK